MAGMTRVLYVDDDPDFLEISRKFLEKSGELSVATARTAPGALDLLKGECFDAVVSDYELPGMDGIRFLMEVRAHHGRIPFILFTGKGREDIVIEALNNGADFYLRKVGEPAAQFTELLNKIRTAVERYASDKAFRESEEIFREVFNNANDAIFLHEMLPGGFPGRYFRVNDVACLYLGYSKEELYNMSPPEIVSPQHRLKMLGIVVEINSKGSAMFEAEYQRKDGSLLPVEVSTHLFILQGRKVALSISRDTSERKKTEEALRESERKYRELIEYANEAINVAQDGMLKLANPRMAELTGYPVETLCSMPFQSFIYPDDQSMVVERHEKRMKGEDVPSRYVFRLAGKEGDIKWVEISSVAINYEGRPATLNFLSDITERKKTEEALKESEEFNRGLVENIPDLVVVYGHDRRVRYVNPAADRMLGHSPEGREGTDILSYVVPEKRSEIGEVIEERLRSGNTNSLEIEIVGDEGRRMTMISRSTPVRYHEEPAVLLLLTNISDRKTLENQLTMRAEELTRLSSSLAMANKKLNLLGSLTRHDIINKLTLISGYTSQLKKKVPDPALTPYFEKQENAIRKIDEYLRFSKTYEEIGIKTPVWLNVMKTVRQGFASIPHGEITLDGDLDGIFVYADPLFEKVFPNLLDNSVRHGGHVTMVRVYAGESDDQLTLFWEDDGTGIPDEEKQRIFDRGYGKNTGLGLFLVSEILSITGITIKESGEPGKGIRIEITIPKSMWRKEGKT
jgi:PAS domain S-box-containing protein